MVKSIGLGREISWDALRRQWDALITPKGQLAPMQQEQARFLATLLIVITPVSIIFAFVRIVLRSAPVFTQPEFWITIAAVGCIATAYFLCRHGALQASIYFIIVSITGIIFSGWLFNRDYFERVQAPYLLMPLIAASVLFPLRRVVVLASVIFALQVVILSTGSPPRLSVMASDRLSFYVIGAVGIIIITWYRNIQESVRSQELAEGQGRYRDLFQATFEAIAVHKDGIYVDVNPAFERMMGYSRSEIIGMSFLDIVAEEAKPTLLATIKNVTGEISYESIARSKDGALFPVAVYSKPFQFQNQAMRIVSVRDLTLSRQSEQQRFDLAMHRDRANLLENLMNELAHDLKTPISTIDFNLSLLEIERDEYKRQPQISAIKRQLAQVTELMENILLMSRVERGMLVKNEPLQLNNIVVDVTDWLQTQAAAKAITLRLELDAHLATLYGDYSALWRMLLNLVKNSIVYSTPNRNVIVRTGLRDQWIMLTVADEGPGIAAADVPHIFDRYYRGKDASSGDGGTGLGLAIVKAIVEAHHGQIEIDSAPGQGTTFRILLPMEPLPLQTQPS